MSQVDGYKGLVGYSLRELDLSEINFYCPNINKSISSSILFIQNQTNFTSDFMLRSYSSGCYYYDVLTGKWSSYGMDIYEDTNLKQTHCSTNHLTMFAGGLVLLPSTIDFKYAFSNPSPLINPLIYSTILLVTCFYIVFGLWAKWMDWRDSKKRNLIFMKDNYPNDTYYYELTFFTGDKNESGTNSKVVILYFFILSYFTFI